MKCKYSKKCKYYNETSDTCNKNQFKEDDIPYCGKFRELSKVLIVMFAFIFLIGIVSAIECGSTPTDGCTVSTSTIFDGGIYILNSTGGNGSININANNVVLDGNGTTIYYAKDGVRDKYGIKNFGFNNTVIKNIRLIEYIGTNYTSINFADKVGINIKNSNNITIDNANITTISQLFSYGINAKDSDNITIKNSFITTYGNDSSPIHFNSIGTIHSGGNIENNTINFYGRSNTASIWIQQVSYVNISNNYVNFKSEGPSTGIKLENQSNYGTISNNHIYGNITSKFGYGIFLELGTSYSNINNNFINMFGNLQVYGVQLDTNVNNNIVYNNNISTNCLNNCHGVRVLNTLNNYRTFLNGTSNNLIYDNFIKTNGPSSIGIYIFQNNTNNNTIFKNNITSQGIGILIELDSWFQNISNNIIETTIYNSSYTSHGISVRSNVSYNNIMNNKIKTYNLSSHGLIINSSYNNYYNNKIEVLSTSSKEIFSNYSVNNITLDGLLLDIYSFIGNYSYNLNYYYFKNLNNENSNFYIYNLTNTLISYNNGTNIPIYGTNQEVNITLATNQYVYVYTNTTTICDETNTTCYMNYTSFNPIFNETVDGNYNLTFTDNDQNFLTKWYNWIVDGISQLVGYGQNVFTYVFHLNNQNGLNSTVIMSKTDNSTGNNITSNTTFIVIANTSAPSIVLNYPTSLIDYATNNQTLQLNLTATDSNLDKVWYEYENNASLTNITPVFNTGNYWNFTSNSTSGSSGDFFIDKIIGGNYQIRPHSNVYGYWTTPISYKICDYANFSNSTVVEFSTDNNGKYLCFKGYKGDYYLGQIFSNRTINWAKITPNIISGATSGLYNLSNITLSTKKNITIYANDTAGNLNSSTFSWDYKVWDNGISYYSPVFIGSVNQIIGNYTLTETPSNITLVYNGTVYNPSISVSGNEYILTTNATAPSFSVDTNISFYYSFLVNGTTINSYLRNQTIQTAGITTNCVGNYSFINISNYDEESLVSTVGTVEYTISLYNSNLLMGTANGSFTGSNLSICSTKNLSNSSSTFNLQLRYYKNDSTTTYKTYNIQSALISMIPMSLNLYFLNVTLGTTFNINYKDFSYQIHPNALIQIQRNYLNLNQYKIVEIPIIGNEGSAKGSFNTNNVEYKIVIVENGQIIDSFDHVYPKCQSLALGQCELDLRGNKSVSTITDGDFNYYITQGSQNITLTYVIPSGTPKSVTFVTNQSSRFINGISNCNSSQYASGGTITCDYNNTVGDSVVSVQIDVSGQDSLFGSLLVSENTNALFFLNNYFIGFILLLTIGLMFISSGVILVIVGAVGVVYLGLIFLLKGVSLEMVATSTIWLIIAVGLIVYKLSQKEEKYGN